MSEAKMRLNVYDMKPSKSLQRMVQKQVEKWIAREQSLLFLPKECSYDVTIDREPHLSLTTCELRVHIGSKIWESHEVGKTAEHALIGAIQRLRPSQLIAFAQRNYSEPTARTA